MHFSDPVELKAILDYAKWLLNIIRLIVSGIIGIIFAYAAYKKATDISGAGAAKAKEIAWNCWVAMFWLWSCTAITGFFIGKLETML